MSNAAVKAPIGIKLLSIAFGIWPAGWLASVVYAFCDDYVHDRLANEDLNLLLIEILFCLVLIFMLSSVAVGLWKLEEGARKVALMSSVMLFPVVTFPLIEFLSGKYVGPPNWSSILSLGSLSIGSGWSVCYLHSRRIKAAFNELQVLNLDSQ